MEETMNGFQLKGKMKYYRKCVRQAEAWCMQTKRELNIDTLWEWDRTKNHDELVGSQRKHYYTRGVREFLGLVLRTYTRGSMRVPGSRPGSAREISMPDGVSTENGYKRIEALDTEERRAMLESFSFYVKNKTLRILHYASRWKVKAILSDAEQWAYAEYRKLQREKRRQSRAVAVGKRMRTRA